MRRFIRKMKWMGYPLLMKISRATGLGIRRYVNEMNVPPRQPFYSLKAVLNNGEEISFEAFKNKKIFIVNLASDCAFTPQYAALQKLHMGNEGLIVLGFPSNDFGQQEPGKDHEILDFCSKNYGVTFPLFKKDHVKGQSKQPVYRWLTDKNKNGWNEMEPRWNFYKYLIDENGILTTILSSSISPSGIRLK